MSSAYHCMLLITVTLGSSNPNRSCWSDLLLHVCFSVYPRSTLESSFRVLFLLVMTVKTSHFQLLNIKRSYSFSSRCKQYCALSQLFLSPSIILQFILWLFSVSPLSSSLHLASVSLLGPVLLLFYFYISSFLGPFLQISFPFLASHPSLSPFFCVLFCCCPLLQKATAGHDLFLSWSLQLLALAETPFDPATVAPFSFGGLSFSHIRHPEGRGSGLCSYSAGTLCSRPCLCLHPSVSQPLRFSQFVCTPVSITGLLYCTGLLAPFQPLCQTLKSGCDHLSLWQLACVNPQWLQHTY